MTKNAKVGRPKKDEKEKKIQVISYIPRMNAKKFSKEIEPLIKKYSII